MEIKELILKQKKLGKGILLRLKHIVRGDKEIWAVDQLDTRMNLSKMNTFKKFIDANQFYMDKGGK